MIDQVRKRLVFDVEKKVVDVQKNFEGTVSKPYNEKDADDKETNEIYEEAFYEETFYANVKDEKNESNKDDSSYSEDEKAIQELLIEEDRAEREMEERLRERKEYEDLMWKIEWGIAETKDFGRWKYETSWDALHKYYN